MVKPGSEHRPHLCRCLLSSLWRGEGRQLLGIMRPLAKPPLDEHDGEDNGVRDNDNGEKTHPRGRNQVTQLAGDSSRGRPKVAGPKALTVGDQGGYQVI